jgi:hypothetical protein
MEQGRGTVLDGRGLSFGSTVALEHALCTHGTVTNGQYSVVFAQKHTKTITRTRTILDTFDSGGTWCVILK